MYLEDCPLSVLLTVSCGTRLSPLNYNLTPRPGRKLSDLHSRAPETKSDTQGNIFEKCKKLYLKNNDPLKRISEDVRDF